MISASMQAFMDSSDWLKSIEESSGSGMDSSNSSPPTELIACSRPPVMERRLRPPHDQALKCPRCDSTHTKFCYYNNYSLSQPRYFCKTCRRYWTKGGSLRNVPVGGGCRKNKRSSGKKQMEQQQQHPPQLPQPISCFHDATDLHLSFSLPHHDTTSLPGSPHGLNFTDCNPMLGLELMDSKFGAATGMQRNHCHYFGGSGMGLNMNQNLLGTNGMFHGLNPLSYSNHGSIMEAYQRMSSLPFGGQEMNHEAIDVKPAERMLTLEWQEPGCAEAGRESFGYGNGLGLWAGMLDGHGSSAAI